MKLIQTARLARSTVFAMLWCAACLAPHASDGIRKEQELQVIFSLAMAGMRVGPRSN